MYFCDSLLNGTHVGATCSIRWLNGDDNTYGCSWDDEEAFLKCILNQISMYNNDRIILVVPSINFYILNSVI